MEFINDFYKNLEASMGVVIVIAKILQNKNPWYMI
jgi:hypothetical protein